MRFRGSSGFSRSEMNSGRGTSRLRILRRNSLTSPTSSQAHNQGGAALAVKLPSFKGLLKRELIPNIRLGTEMARRAVFWGRVGGIFHSDELPAYGIDSSHVERVARSLGC